MATSTQSSKQPKFEILSSRNFNRWLYQQQLSIAFTTYQLGKIFMVGLSADGGLHVTERTFPRCMGLGGDTQTLWMSSLYQIWRFENSLEPGQAYNGYDRIYLPQMAYTTGDLDVHDIVVGKNKKPVFVNTKFSCIATISETHSFKPLWKPDFISHLVPEDRCHLNGLAAVDGEAAYATLVGRSNVADGWREHRGSGGLLMDIRSNEVICGGLSMPHSPRWYDGKLWLLEAGTGYFGYADPNTGKFERVAFCPGFLRGLSFHNGYAFVGMSGTRENRTFSGLQLDENLKTHHAQARCGIQIINLATGATEHWLRMEGMINELYDIKALPQVRRPLIIGVQRDEIQKMISIEPGRS